MRALFFLFVVMFATPGWSGQSLASATFGDIVFEVTDAVAQGNALVVTGYVTDRGVDQHLYLNGCGDTRKYPRLLDGQGNTFTPSEVMLGNQRCNAEIANGTRTKFTLRFLDMPTAAGGLEATQVRQLTLTVRSSRPGSRDSEGQVTFERLSIRTEAGARGSAAPAAPVPPAAPASALAAPQAFGDLSFEILS